MCFRPDSAGGGGPMKCPGCGKPIQMMAGITLDKCPFCKEDFTPYLNGEKPIPGQEGAAYQDDCYSESLAARTTPV